MWETFYIATTAFQEGMCPYLGLLNFLMEIRVREEINGNLGLNESRELLLTDHSSSYLAR